MYESLCIYVANIDLVGDPLQGIYRIRMSELLILNALDILSRNSKDVYVVHGVNVLGS